METPGESNEFGLPRRRSVDFSPLTSGRFRPHSEIAMKSPGMAITVLCHAVLCPVARADTRFEISYDKAVASGPITGRVILIIARSDRPEPRFQIAPNMTPIFGVDVHGLQPAQAAVIDQTTFGHP